MPSPERYWQLVGDHFLSVFTGRTASTATVVQNASGETLSAESRPSPSQEASGKTRSHDKVTPPVLLSMPEPRPSRAAVGLGYSSTVEVYLWVDTDGKPVHLEVRRPAGLGLDEQALAAVAGYTFKPATQDGIPIKVDLYVDVNFRN